MTPNALGAAIRKASDGGEVVRSLFQTGLDSYRRELTQRFLAQYGHVIQTGVFRGMALPEEASWGDGDKLPKLLGSYEMELHPVLENAFAQDYSLVLNIGCAEGYYAVGAARRLASARVCAFDVSDTARRVCAKSAEINGAADRLEVYGRCCAETLEHLLTPGAKCLLIIDCEGAEIQLLKPDLVPALSLADMLIECHDFVNRRLTKRLCERFAQTHEIEWIREGARPAAIHPFLQRLTGFERALAMCEFRPEPMHWLFCSSRAREG